MFDLGFSELLMIALVALVVLGPERLPKAARFAGLWVRRARAQWYSVKSELEREIAAEELKRNLDAVRTAAADLDRDAREAAGKVQGGVRDAGNVARREVRALEDGFHGRSPSAGSDADAQPSESDASGNAQPSEADASGDAAASASDIPAPTPDVVRDDVPEPRGDGDAGR